MQDIHRPLPLPPPVIWRGKTDLSPFPLEYRGRKLPPDENRSCHRCLLALTLVLTLDPALEPTHELREPAANVGCPDRHGIPSDAGPRRRELCETKIFCAT